MNSLEQVEHAHRAVGVEISGRFIGEDQARVVDERARDRDPLPFAATQLAGAVLGAIEEANLVEQIAGLRLSVRRCRQRRGQLDVLPCGEQVEEAEMLKDESERGSPTGG